MLPTAWFRNTWSWDEGEPKPPMRLADDAPSTSTTPSSGRSSWSRTPPTTPAPANAVAPTPLFCENETNTQRLFDCAGVTPYPKDGINDHVVSGAPTVNPEQEGTKCAFWYQLTVQPGATATIRLRLRPKQETGTTVRSIKKILIFLSRSAGARRTSSTRR